jgi:hypothetical protein
MGRKGGGRGDVEGGTGTDVKLWHKVNDKQADCVTPVLTRMAVPGGFLGCSCSNRTAAADDSSSAAWRRPKGFSSSKSMPMLGCQVLLMHAYRAPKGVHAHANDHGGAGLGYRCCSSCCCCWTNMRRKGMQQPDHPTEVTVNADSASSPAEIICSSSLPLRDLRGSLIGC